MPLETNILRTIFGVAREHHISNEDIHEAIEAGFQKKSLKDLTKAEAMQLIDGIRGRRAPAERMTFDRRQAMARHGRRDHNPKTDVEYLVNSTEHHLLSRAAKLRNWDESKLTAFISRQLGRPAIRTMAEFNKVFWALKAMNRRDGLQEGA